MTVSRPKRDAQVGQIIVLFTLSVVVILLATGLVVDGGNAWAQRRQAQNAADLASLAGTRPVAINMGALAQVPPAPLTATDADVRSEVESSLAANGIVNPALGVNYTATYVDSSFNAVPGYGLGGAIPPTAIGVEVGVSKRFSTYFMGLIGMPSWTASTTAISKAGWYPGTVGSPGGNLVPIAVSLDALPKGTNQNVIVCPTGDPPIPPGSGPCVPIPMTDNTNGNITPGQFAWLSWSGDTSATYTCGTGQTPGGILGPPANSPTYPQIPPNTWIQVPGNTGVSNTCKSNVAAWVALHTTVIVPIVSPGPGPTTGSCPPRPAMECFPDSSVPYPPQSQGNGANTTYNVIGFAGFEVTGCKQAFGVGNGPCINEIWGVFRQVLFAGPTGSTPGTNGVNGAFLGIQLVK